MYDYGDDYEQYYNPEDFLEEYEVQLRDLIVNATNNKIKNTIEELKSEKENNKKLEQELKELRSNLHNTNRIHKEQLDKALIEKQKEVEEKLSCGFVPHDTVWYIKSKSTQTVCEKCNGQYKIKVDVLGKEKEVDCPYCSYGKVTHFTYYPVKDIVSSIYIYFNRIDKNKKNSGIQLNVKEIYLDKYDYTMNINNLYKTEEECQTECDKKNKESK